jgi:hypothetical protein
MRWTWLQTHTRTARAVKPAERFGGFIGSVFITAKDAKGAKEGRKGIDKNLLRVLRALRGLI